MRRPESSGPLPCHDFLFSLEGNKWPMLHSSRSSLYWCALVLHFSLGACCAKKPCEDRLHTSETLFRAPQWFCTFQKGPRYYSAGDFKHFPNSFWFSLMHSHARHSLSSRSTGCVSIIKGLLTHMITGMAHWHMPSPPGNQTLISPPPPPPVCVFSLHYTMTGIGDSVFFWRPPSSDVPAAWLTSCGYGNWVLLSRSRPYMWLLESVANMFVCYSWKDISAVAAKNHHCNIIIHYYVHF